MDSLESMASLKITKKYMDNYGFSQGNF